MGFNLIDLSYIYYKKANSSAIPRQRGGKFIRVSGAGDDYIIMSPKGLSVYHANIAERFLLTKGVTGTYNSKHDHLEPDDSGWIIQGGGFWAIDDMALTLDLNGSSMAYGAFSSAALKEGFSEALKGYRVTLG